MNLYVESLLYGLQIASVFILAGPVMVRAERQRTLSLNPEWLSSNPEFLQANHQATLKPLAACGILLTATLAAATAAASPVALFAVHGPLFLLAIVGLALFYGKSEARLRGQIPKDAIRRAPLINRTLFRYLPPWSVLLLGALLAAIFAINGFGFFTRSIAPERVMGNLLLIVVFQGVAAYGLFQVVKRQPYRLSTETDELARRFELRMVLAAAYFFCAVGMFHALGSLGPDPVFTLPPTLLHARLEGTPFSWERFFTDPQYRWVDYGATAFLILLSLWIANNRFYRKVLAVDFRNAPDPLEV